MRLGYNTNGLTSHRLEDAIALVGDLGYQAIAITLDHHALDPYADDLTARVARARAALARHHLEVVIETGARFLLDPTRKHRPTLLDDAQGDRARRVDFLGRAIDLAAALGGSVVSLWSGVAPPGRAGPELDDRLVAGLTALCRRAATAGVVLGFEPEPGMYVERVVEYRRIVAAVGHPALRLTLDVGHAHLTEPDALVAIDDALPDVVNVHLEGMWRARHDHLAPWDGDLDVGAALRALRRGGYRGPACYELSRHAHDAVEIARRALAFARDALA